MKKILLSLLVIVGFLGFSFFYDEKRLPQEINSNSNLNPTNNSTSNNVTNSNSLVYKDGEYIGDLTDAIYGNIQIKLVIKNGKITDVIFLTFPNDLPHTREVSAMALPILRQETIQSQSANVDNVTGATQTTDGYIQSVKSALDKAIG